MATVIATPESIQAVANYNNHIANLKARIAQMQKDIVSSQAMLDKLLAEPVTLQSE